jgi:ribosomal protein S18 acetylase RimI-like enzyme
MSIELRPMTDDEFVAWLPQMRDSYAQAMIDDAGFTPEAAAEKAAADMGQLFPEGNPSAEQLVFVIEADGEPVGELWLAERADMSGHPCLFVYDIHVRGSQQGRGYGRAAMLFAEDEARRRGVDRVALNVFGRNAVARGLYRSLGYEENAVAMSKIVEPPAG